MCHSVVGSACPEFADLLEFDELPLALATVVQSAAVPLEGRDPRKWMRQVRSLDELDEGALSPSRYVDQLIPVGRVSANSRVDIPEEVEMGCR